MLKNILNCFTSRRPSGPQRPTSERFQLYKKDDQYFADPDSLRNLDKFEAHKTAAEELNGYLAQLNDVRTAVGSLEGTQADKNLRPDVVAVDGLDVKGQSVDAVLRTSGPTSRQLEARLQDSKATVIMKEDVYLGSQSLEFQNGNRSYEVDNTFDKSYVSVTLKDS
jgi:hypothetical protein